MKMNILFVLLSFFCVHITQFAEGSSNLDQRLKRQASNSIISTNSLPSYTNVGTTIPCKIKLQMISPVDLKFSIRFHSCTSFIAPEYIYFPANTTSEVSLDLVSIKPGNCVFQIFDQNNHSVEEKIIVVVKEKSLFIICSIVGWIYFLCWSISFYPQCIENYQLQSVAGLNFDFVSINISGYVCYSIFNVGLYWIPAIREQYFNRFGDYNVPVFANDVFFALHGFILTAFTIGQCIYYTDGSQRISYTAKGFISCFIIYGLVTTILAACHVIEWLDFITWMSFVKLFITIIKYVPQAYHNYKRKSTKGWSILNIILDFTGGNLSILQMLIMAYNRDDWVTLLGNPSKLGVGIVSIAFDTFFIVQHYILYKDSWKKSGGDGNNNNNNGAKKEAECVKDSLPKKENNISNNNCIPYCGKDDDLMAEIDETTKLLR